MSGGGEVLSQAADLAVKSNHSVGIELPADFAATPKSIALPVDDDEFDLDSPTQGFASIPEAIEDIRQGKVSCFFL